MISDWAQWWCQQFNYGSCASIPVADRFWFWAKTIVGLWVAVYLVTTAVATLLIGKWSGSR